MPTLFYPLKVRSVKSLLFCSLTNFGGPIPFPSGIPWPIFNTLLLTDHDSRFLDSCIFVLPVVLNMRHLTWLELVVHPHTGLFGDWFPLHLSLHGTFSCHLEPNLLIGLSIVFIQVPFANDNVCCCTKAVIFSRSPPVPCAWVDFPCCGTWPCGPPVFGECTFESKHGMDWSCVASSQTEWLPSSIVNFPRLKWVFPNCSNTGPVARILTLSFSQASWPHKNRGDDSYCP